MCILPAKVELCKFCYLGLISLLSELSFAADLPEASLIMQLKNHPHNDKQRNSNNALREMGHSDITTAQAPLESGQISEGSLPPTQSCTEE